jgi:hypothetical protein
MLAVLADAELKTLSRRVVEVYYRYVVWMYERMLSLGESLLIE